MKVTLDLFWYMQEHCQADSTICGKKWASVSDQSHEQGTGKCCEALLLCRLFHCQLRKDNEELTEILVFLKRFTNIKVVM